jgi:hypothetical protein
MRKNSLPEKSDKGGVRYHFKERPVSGGGGEPSRRNPTLQGRGAEGGWLPYGVIPPKAGIPLLLCVRQIEDDRLVCRPGAVWLLFDPEAGGLFNLPRGPSSFGRRG